VRPMPDDRDRSGMCIIRPTEIARRSRAEREVARRLAHDVAIVACPTLRDVAS
jgi:hypothetical protein